MSSDWIHFTTHLDTSVQKPLDNSNVKKKNSQLKIKVKIQMLKKISLNSQLKIKAKIKYYVYFISFEMKDMKDMKERNERNEKK